MGDLSDAFEERLRQLDAYLDLLDAVQAHVGSGSRTGGQSLRVSEQQQRILHASVYLQLYNLVEATITRCIDSVSEAAARDALWRPGDLSGKLRREWVRSTVASDTHHTIRNRLESAVKLSDWIIAGSPVAKFKIARGGGGNWDDKRIEEFAECLGLVLTIPDDIKKEVKRRRRNDKGALGLVKAFRNDLAHGRLSFDDCGAGDTVSDLRLLRKWTAAYLREVVTQFEAFILGYEFLAPDRRPTGATA